MEISLSELSEVKGIGQKTIERVREYKLAEDGYVSEYNEDLHLDVNSVNQGDCLELMNGIPDESVNMILADLPYGTTACSWDSIIDLDRLWFDYERVVKDNGAIVLTASQPFTTKLINSNLSLFRYCWYWIKERGTGFAISNKQPMRKVEEVCVFYKNAPLYNSKGEKLEDPYRHALPIHKSDSDSLSNKNINSDGSRQYKTYTHKKKNNVLEFSRDNAAKGIHPTQKPVALFEYLIKTYTNKGDVVLDNVAGSGTTGVACKNLNRNYILIEKEEEYTDLIVNRLSSL